MMLHTLLKWLQKFFTGSAFFVFFLPLSFFNPRFSFFLSFVPS